MQKTLLLSIGLLFSVFSFGQTSAAFWTTVNENSIDAHLQLNRSANPLKYTTYELDFDAMKSYLATAPMERTYEAKHNPLVLSIPQPDGSVEDFEIVEAPVMEPGLQAKFPDLKAYAGRSIENPSRTIRFDQTPAGFHSIIMSTEGTLIIDNYGEDNRDYYLSYWEKDVPVTEVFHCGTTDQSEINAGINMADDIQTPAASSREETAELYVYRMALSCTGEWGATHGGDIPGVMATYTTIVMTLNSIWERDVAIRFVLVENNDELVFTDGMTDDYLAPTSGGGLLNQNVALLNGIIGEDNFDVGHVFTIGCSDVGGVAGGAACTPGKGAGVTCNGGSNVVGAVLNIMAHEIGHQFTGGHTWNSCGIPDQFSGSTAWEPGSGSTILSYQGACGSDNITGASPFEYFNIGSIDQFYNHSRIAVANCAEVIDLDHTMPSIEINLPEDLYIPIRTSFELDMEVTDMDDDGMTYNWEQYDTGPPSPLGSPMLNAPSFRSYAPDENTNRYFPRIDRIVNAVTSNHEVLPTYSRNFTFLGSARDNNPSGGNIAYEQFEFKATDTAGPFKVLTYNTDTTLEVGAYVEIGWDVANTDSALVNCQFVNIRMSMDGGYTYPITLIEGVPNDGSQYVHIPNVSTTQARFRVDAAKNIFFDINNGDVTIVPPSEPGFTAVISPYLQEVCLPDAGTIFLTTSSLLDYDEEITFSVNGLPTGINPVFDNNPVAPGFGTILTLDAANLMETGVFNIEIVATTSTDTFYRDAVIDVVVNDFSDLSLTSPAEGTAGVSEVPMFQWTAAVNADLYEIEVATNPAFGEYIVQTEILAGTEWAPPVQLDKTTLYYWRVRPINVCGEGAYTNTMSFHTETFACTNEMSTNVPVFVPGSVTTVESSYFIPTSGEINDLNIVDMKLNFAPVGFLVIDLVSPDGIEVRLFENNCGGTNLIDIGFDDEAASDIDCPPIGGIFFKPVGSLSDFDGTDSEGEWLLRVTVTEAPFNGGDLESWGIEMCANASPQSPYIVNNETLDVRVGDGQWIYDNFLLVQDDNNAADELEFTVVSLPLNGDLVLSDNVLEIGQTYRQSSINAANLKYVHDGTATTSDFFTFTVNDGEGGYLGNTVFNISLDENNPPLGTNELDKIELKLFPNPAQNLVNIELENVINDDLQISIFDVQGRLVQQNNLNGTGNLIELNTTRLLNGIYFVQLLSDSAIATKKFTIQK